MIGKDQAVTRAAADLLSRYGEDAGVIAMMKSAEAAADSDLELSDFWLEVGAACEAPLPRH